jgi:hypothetical protein
MNFGIAHFASANPRPLGGLLRKDVPPLLSAQINLLPRSLTCSSISAGWFWIKPCSTSGLRLGDVFQPIVQLISEVKDASAFDEVWPRPSARVHSEGFHGESEISRGIFPVHPAVGKDYDVD